MVPVEVPVEVPAGGSRSGTGSSGFVVLTAFEQITEHAQSLGVSRMWCPVPGTPLQPPRGCSSRMRWSVHGSAGVLLNEKLTGAHARPLCRPPYLLWPC